VSQFTQPTTIAWRRKATNAFMLGLCVLAVAFALIVLVAILGYIVTQGGRALNADFFTQLPKPVGETGGGMANAIVGTIVLIAIAGVIGLPIGVGAGVYLAEYGRSFVLWPTY